MALWGLGCATIDFLEQLRQVSHCSLPSLSLFFISLSSCPCTVDMHCALKCTSSCHISRHPGAAVMMSQL